MAAASLLDAVLPADAAWWHVANEGRRDAKTGAKLKALGMRSGFPDLCIAWRGRLLTIELKAPGKTMPKTQREYRRVLERAGVICSVAHSLDAVERCVRDFGIPLRGRLSA